MAQINSGVRALLSFPGLYDLWSEAVGANNAWSELARLYLRLKPGQSLLDIGCGTAGIIKHLPNGVSYTGFDLSPGYIAKARVRFGRRGTFICGSVADHIALPIFDVAMAYGVLHH